MTPVDRAAALEQALVALRARVESAATAAGRDPADVELLPVTKFFPVSDIVELVRLGAGNSANRANRKPLPRLLQFPAIITPV